MSKRNQTFSLFPILLFVLILILLSGCRKEKDSSVITFVVGGAPAELDFWQELIDDFQTQTGIKVILLRQPTDTDLRRQGLVTSLRSKITDPDVFLMDVAWLAQFAASGWLEPLDTYIEKNQIELEVFFGKVINLSDRYGDQFVALPVYVDGGILYYRKDLLKEYGIKEPPQTWEELLEQSKKVQSEVRKTNPNFYAFVWEGAQYEGLVCNWMEFAGSNNGGFIFKDKNIVLNTKENMQATTFMRDIIHKYKISPPNTYTEMKEEQVRTFFQNENALFERNWPYAWALHQSDDSLVKGKVAITALPHFLGGHSVSTLGGWHIGISKHSDQKEKSFKFVKFVVSFNIQKQLALKLGWNPGRKDVYTDPEIGKKLPHFVSLKDVFENLTSRPNLPYYTLISDMLQRHLNSVLSGNETADDALMVAEEETRKIIQRYGQTRIY